jgi:manganese/zinc/iron transport system substrate-binding protein
MAGADVIVYSGLHLEGKMTEIFEQMERRHIHTVAVAEGAIPDSLRIVSPNFAGSFDPHVWFDVRLWMRAAAYVSEALAELDPPHADAYRSNADRYLEDLTALDAYVRERAADLPADRRVLITSHDAFGYYGRAYNFHVEALQGLSTATEAGTADVKALAEFVVDRRIPAMFIESSVSPRGIEAVKEAVRARGFDVRIGGNLYSDSLGDPDGPDGTYIGTVRHNIDTVVEALTGDLSTTPVTG